MLKIQSLELNWKWLYDLQIWVGYGWYIWNLSVPDAEHSTLLTSKFAILIVLESNEGDVNINRIGSNPLEHLIGSFRMLSKNKKHTYKKLNSVIEREELIKQIKSVLGIGSIIRGRISSYARRNRFCKSK